MTHNYLHTNGVIRVTFLFAIFAAIAIPANSQDSIDTDFGIKGGWIWFLDEPLENSIGNQWMIGGEMKVWWPNGVGMGVELQYTDSGEEVAEGAKQNLTIGTSSIPFNINGYLRTGGENEGSFYFGIGPSIVFADLSSTAVVDDVRVRADVTDTIFGFNGVLGYEFSNSLFLEFQWLFAEGQFEIAGREDKLEIQHGGSSLWVGYRF